MSDELKPWEQAAKNKNINNTDIKPWEQAATLKKKGPSIASSTPTTKPSEIGGMTDLSGIAAEPKLSKPSVLTTKGEESYVKPIKPLKAPQENKKIKNIESDGSFLGDLGAMFLKSANSKETDENLKSFRKLPAEEVTQAIDYVGDKLPDRVKNAWAKGKIQGQIANTLYTGAEPDENSLIKIAELNQQSSLIPESEESKKLNSEYGLSWALNNPIQGSKALGEIILSSLGAQFEASKRTTGEAVAIGAAAGSVIPGIGTGLGATSGFTAGQIAAGFNLETSGKILDVLSDLKIDIKDPNSLIQAFKNPEIMDKARDLAIKRAIPIAVLDLLTAGIAGKVGGAKAITKVGKIAKGLSVAGIEAAGGSLGELGAQVASGEKINKNSILLEGIAELGSGAPSLISETAGTVLSRNKTSTSDVNIRKQVATDPKTAISEVKQNLDKQLQVGLITQEDYDSGIKTLENTVAKNEKVPEIIDGETREKTLELIEDRDNRKKLIDELESQKQKVDVAFHSAIDDSIKFNIAKIEELNNQIADLGKKQVETKQQENAIQEPSTESQVSPTGEAGQVIPEGGEGVGQGEQGKEVTQEVNSKEVEKLRAEEQAEYDAMENPEDEVERQKIYDKYDKLISPLLTEAPQPQGVRTVKLEVNQDLSDNGIGLRAVEGEDGKFTIHQEIDGKIVGKSLGKKFDTIEQLQNEYEGGIKDKLTAEAIKQATAEVSTKELLDAQNKLKKARSEASKNRLIQDVQKLSTPEQFKQFIQDNPEFSKNLPKQEEVIPSAPLEDLEIEGEIETPSEAKKREIEKRQKELLNNIRKKLGNLSSGFNPDIIPDLIKLGATYIELGAVNFKDFAEQLKAAYGSDIPEDNLRDIFDKSAQSLGKGIRNITKRIATDEGLSPTLREIANEANAVYERQDYDKIQESLDNMSEADKNALVGSLENATGELSKEGNIGVLAAIDLINKYEAAGDKVNATRIFDIVSKSSTVFAQLLRQYAELKSSTVQGFLSLVEKNLLKKYGVQLTDAQKSDIEALYDIFKDKTEKAKEALDNHVRDFTSNSQKELGKANIELEDAVRLLNDYIDKVKPKSFKTLADKMIQTIQGNLLTLKSLVVNPLANYIQYGYRFSGNELSNFLDLVISNVAGKERQRISGFNKSAMRLPGKAGIEGFKMANRLLLKGAASSELSKYDISGRLKPVEAWKSLFNTIRGKEKATVLGVLNDLVEGIPGATSNLALRLLPYGDLPMNKFATAYKLVEIGLIQKKLTGKNLERFVISPDAESLKIAEEYGDKATLQNKTKAYDLINTALSSLDKESGSSIGNALKSVLKVAIRGLQVPFLKTPINAAIITFRYSNPGIPLIQAVIQLGKIIEYGQNKKMSIDLKNQKINEARYKATGYLGEAIISQVVLTSAIMLAKYGLTTGAAPDKDKKERDFMYNTFGPNQLNISGLQRLLSGGDPSMQQYDKSISYSPMGVFGAQLGIVTEGIKAKEKEAERQKKFVTTKGEQFYKEIWDSNTELGNGLFSNLPASAKYMLDQGFVQGTSSLLASVSEGDYDKWSNQWVKTFTTGLSMPNTISQTLRASNEYMTNTFSEDDATHIANTVKNVYGATEDLPIKYDMWGKPIPVSPKGTNPYFYNVIDIFRTQELLQDKYSYYVYLLYKKTNDKSAIPSSISDIIETTRSEFKVKLNEKQKAEFQRMVGVERLIEIKNREERNKFDINNNTQDYLERKVASYSRAYDAGLARAKSKFKEKLKQNKI